MSKLCRFVVGCDPLDRLGFNIVDAQFVWNARYSGQGCTARVAYFRFDLLRALTGRAKKQDTGV